MSELLQQQWFSNRQIQNEGGIWRPQIKEFSQYDHDIYYNSQMDKEDIEAYVESLQKRNIALQLENDRMKYQYNKIYPAYQLSKTNYPRNIKRHSEQAKTFSWLKGSDQKQFIEWQKQIQKLKEKRKVLKSKIQRRDLGGLDEEYELLRGPQQTMENQISTSKKYAEDLQNKILILKSEYAKLEIKLMRTNNENWKLENRVKELKNENVDLSGKVQIFKMANIQQKTKIEQLMKQNGVLKTQNQRVDLQNKILTRRNKNLKEQIMKKSSTKQEIQIRKSF